jgi:hypothetical protein
MVIANYISMLFSLINVFWYITKMNESKKIKAMKKCYSEMNNNY